MRVSTLLALTLIFSTVAMADVGEVAECDLEPGPVLETGVPKAEKPAPRLTSVDLLLALRERRDAATELPFDAPASWGRPPSQPALARLPHAPRVVRSRQP